MKTPRRPLTSVLLVLVTGAVCLAPAGLAAQDAPKPPADKPAVAQAAEAAPAPELTPPPMTPKEKTGVYVFLAWTWMTIAVLLYVLALKVREADRVLRTGFYGTPGGGKKPLEH